MGLSAVFVLFFFKTVSKYDQKMPQSQIVDQPTAPRGKGAQWLSGRVLGSRPKGSGFEPHRRHCVVVLEQDTFILA